MEVAPLLSVDRIFVDAEVSSKKRLLQFIAQHSGEALELSEDEIFNNLLDRERLGSTGLGNGFALPHARLENLQQTTAFFLQLKQAINYDAPDQQAVDLVFALFIPQQATEEHLQILSALAGIFRQAEVCREIRQADSAEKILQQIAKAEQ